MFENGKAKESFRENLHDEGIPGDERMAAPNRLGVRLSAVEAPVLACLIRDGKADLEETRTLTGLAGPSATELTRSLSSRAMIGAPDGSAERHELADETGERLRKAGDPEIDGPDVRSRNGSGRVQVAEQVASLGELSDEQVAIVANADSPQSVAEIMKVAGHTQRASFTDVHFKPLIRAGVLRVSVPRKPNSPKQRHVLMRAGPKLRALHLATPSRAFGGRRFRANDEPGSLARLRLASDRPAIGIRSITVSPEP